MPRKEKTKAPDIDVLARHYLSHGLRKHPDVAQHVANIDDLEQMPMWSLLTLAKKIGVDADTTIRATKAKVAYEHTPEWEYYDLQKKTPYTGRGGTSYHIEVAAVPQQFHEDDTVTSGTPYWVHMEDVTREDVLPHDAWDALLDAVDEQCKLVDAERRRVAAAQQAKVTPTSRKRH